MMFTKKLWLFGLLCLAMSASAEFPTSYVGGEMDLKTPQIRILSFSRPGQGTPTWVHIPQKYETIPVIVQVSPEFVFCGECVAPLPQGYGQLPQIPNRGHVHVYFKRKGPITDNRLADVFCPFNVFNESTKEIKPGVWQSECETPQKGEYKMCAVIETDSHTQRVKAVPRDFPPVDCIEIKVLRGIAR